MSKRARRDILTGGTGDVNPEIFRCRLPSTASTVSSTEFPLPVQRLNNRGRAMVMEILKVAYDLPIATMVDADAQVQITMSTNDRGTAAVARSTDSGVFDQFKYARFTNDGFLNPDAKPYVGTRIRLLLVAPLTP